MNSVNCHPHAPKKKKRVAEKKKVLLPLVCNLPFCLHASQMHVSRVSFFRFCFGVIFFVILVFCLVHLSYCVIVIVVWSFFVFFLFFFFVRSSFFFFFCCFFWGVSPKFLLCS